MFVNQRRAHGRTVLLFLVCATAISLTSSRLLLFYPKRVNRQVAQDPATSSLVLGHAHNDYLHEHPLFDAYAAGFCSIEADVFWVFGHLLVAHSWWAMRPHRNLENLYLKPLASLYLKHGGHVYPADPKNCQTVVLLVDFKKLPGVSAVDTYTALEAVLANYNTLYPGLLSSWSSDGSHVMGALSVVVSGNRPDAVHVSTLPTRYSALDGPMSVVTNNEFDKGVYPTISQRWCCTEGSALSGDDSDPHKPTAEQVADIQHNVRLAHQQGRSIRFWEAPDGPSMWDFLADKIGVDYVNTDDLQGFRKWALARQNVTMHHRRPPVAEPRTQGNTTWNR